MTRTSWWCWSSSSRILRPEKEQKFKNNLANIRPQTPVLSRNNLPNKKISRLMHRERITSTTFCFFWTKHWRHLKSRPTSLQIWLSSTCFPLWCPGKSFASRQIDPEKYFLKKIKWKKHWEVRTHLAYIQFYSLGSPGLKVYIYLAGDYFCQAHEFKVI